MFKYFNTTDTSNTWDEVTVQAERQGFILEEGEVVLESYNGLRIIAVPTGHTRQFFGGITCDTFERHEIVTTANEHGVIIGVKGAKVTGGRVALRRW